MLSISISPGSGGFRSAGPQPPTNSVTVNPFSRDRTLFDSRAAFGANGAGIPVSGSGTEGETVEVRALSVGDGGASSTPWVELGPIAAGGWSGQINVPRSGAWYRLQARIKATPWVLAEAATRFGVGHVIAIWGQSEISNMLTAFYSGSTPRPIADAEAVQVIHGADGTPGHAHVSNAQPVTASVAAMAAALIGQRPGEKFAIIFHALPGTDIRQLVNDTVPDRNWANDRALHDYATADGQKVGMAAMSWFAAPGSLGGAYGEALFPLFSGKTLGGSPVAIPGTISYSGGSYRADHWFGELYDYAHTKWIGYGPHRFDIQADMRDATHGAAGTLDQGMSNKQAARASWRAMIASPQAGMFLPAGLEPNGYQNGRDDGAGGWTDLAHPAGGTDDGSPALARQTALAILQSAGLAGWSLPVLDHCQWDPSGSHVEIWSSAGPVTTVRRARNEAALPSTFPHWTAVAGFQVNGLPARHVQILNGRVRITPNAGGAFVFSDVVTFGEGGASGMIEFPDDARAALWKDYPIVDIGVAGIDGVPLRPMPAPAVLANTLPAVTNFSTVSGQSTRFRDLDTWPTTGGKITIAMDLTMGAMAGTPHLFEMENTHVRCNVAADGRVFLSVRDGAGTALLASQQIATVTQGTRFQLIVAVDLGQAKCWTTIGGVTTQAALPANSGHLASTDRRLTLLSRASGTTGFVVGTIYRLEVWTDCVTGGGVPATDAALRTNGRITGGPTVVNAHPWKLGGNVV